MVAKSSWDSRQLATIVDLTTDAVLVCDPSGVIATVNAAAERVFGYRPDELIGQPVSVLVPHRFDGHGDHVARFVDGATTARGMGTPGRVVGRRKDGSEFPARVSIARIGVGDSTLLAAAVTDTSAQDLTDAQISLILDASLAAIVQLTPSGEVLDANPAALELFGVEDLEQFRSAVAEPAHPLATSVATILDLVTPARASLLLHAADGTSMHTICAASALLTPHGAVERVVAVVLDLTAERLLQDRLRRTQERLELAQSIARVGLVEIDVASGAVSTSESMAELLGIGVRELQTLSDVYARLDSASQRRAEELVQRCLATGETGEYDLWVRHGSGERRRLHTRFDGLRGSNGQVEHVLVTGIDITDAHRAQRELLRQARHDALTALLNRSAILAEIDTRLARGDDVSVLFIDLDRFKIVNDTFGHGAGDELLVEAARRIAVAVSSGETVGRFGGDEFVVLCRDNADEAVAAELAQRLLHTLGRPFITAGREVHIGASVGIAAVNRSQPCPDAEVLVRRADLAMYQAKAEGGHRSIAFRPSLEAAASERFALEAAIRDGITNDEFRLHYQPIVHLHSREILAYEGLLRWEGPSGGVGTQALIEVAEESGLIIPLGRRIFDLACEQVAMFSSAASTSAMRVNVNVSALQLAEPTFVAEACEAVQRHGVTSKQLCIEITETALISNPGRTLETLQELRSQGFAVALDDFGTGFASLSHVREFPVTSLKVDRSFIRHLTDGAGDHAIVETVLALGEAFGLSVVAEGIERRDQLELLSSMGCVLGQGYYFSPPVPPERLATGERERALVSEAVAKGASVEQAARR